MDPFYMYVSIGALVLLILILTVFGVVMSRMKSMDSFPPTENACPDYWDVNITNPNMCGIPVNENTKNKGYIKIQSGTKSVDMNAKQNIGMCNGSGFGCKKSGEGTYLELQPNPNNSSNFQYVKLNNNTNWSTLYPGISEKCAKKKWAQTLNISWDGVSNYNGC